MKYSIIIPAYNAEKCIKRCLTSIISQYNNKFEIIVINDGSTDTTLEILNEFSQKYIKVFSIENGGVSKARNYGVAKAIGEFILFVDADDFLADNFFTYIDSINLEKESIYVFNYQEFSNGQYIPDTSSKHVITLSKEETIKYCIKSNSNPYKKTRFNTVWGKLFDRRILSNIRFDENISIGEDSIYFCNAIMNSNRIFYIDRLMYYYYINNTSATHTYNERMYDNDVHWNKRITDILDNIEIPEKERLVKYTILKGLLNNIFLNILNDSSLSFFNKGLKIKYLAKKDLFNNASINLSMLREFDLKDRLILILIKFKMFHIIVFFGSLKRL